ncbi:hypothetical protein B0H63DRAFT_558151 [Podospora didyma]|uniref:Uncharacterized protein n=1 Tax=Podospora didyma TaxID=330526 RepID=A0AAE0NRN3_9PEZI|nr:hypothetical protein B0H63DRAFT_558151 [Podospora didyma]
MHLSLSLAVIAAAIVAPSVAETIAVPAAPDTVVSPDATVVVPIGIPATEVFSAPSVVFASSVRIPDDVIASPVREPDGAVAPLVGSAPAGIAATLVGSAPAGVVATLVGGPDGILATPIRELDDVIATPVRVTEAGSVVTASALLATNAGTAPLAANTIRIMAGKSPYFGPREIIAAVGDVLEFHFAVNSEMDVVMGDVNSPCAPAKKGGFYSGPFVQPDGAPNPNVFRVTINSTDPIIFYSSVGNQCLHGAFGVVNPTCASEMLKQYKQNVDAVLPSATRPSGDAFGGQIVSVPLQETVLVRANPDWSTPGTYVCNVAYLPTLTGAGNVPRVTAGPGKSNNTGTTRDTTTSGANALTLGTVSFFGMVAAIGAVFVAL